MDKETLRNRCTDAGMALAAGLIATTAVTVGVGNFVGGAASLIEIAATGNDDRAEAAMRRANDILHVPLLLEDDPWKAFPFTPIPLYLGIVGLNGLTALRNRYHSSPTGHSAVQQPAAIKKEQ